MFDFLKKYIRPVKRSSSDIETAGGAVIPADAGIQTESGMDPSVKPEDDRPSADFEKAGFMGVPNGDNTTELSSSLVEDQIDSGLGQNDVGIRDDSNVGTGTGTVPKAGSNVGTGTGTVPKAGSNMGTGTGTVPKAGSNVGTGTGTMPKAGSNVGTGTGTVPKAGSNVGTGTGTMPKAGSNVGTGTGT
ncbi:hypothetical protein GW916_15715, partial [bacterium]|nr:hypothetical protein [bacterium]